MFLTNLNRIDSDGHSQPENAIRDRTLVDYKYTQNQYIRNTEQAWAVDGPSKENLHTIFFIVEFSTRKGPVALGNKNFVSLAEFQEQILV